MPKKRNIRVADIEDGAVEEEFSSDPSHERSDVEGQDAGSRPGSAPVEPSMDTELEAAKQDASESYDRFLRAQAELQNVLKRNERERSERLKYAAEGLARDVLPVVDDLDRALEHVSDAGDGLAEGVRLVRSGLLAALERHGVTPIEAVGQPFDPNLHEAVAMVESAEHDPNTVVEEHRPGYRIHDRLLRAAMVVVSKAPSSGPGVDDK